jgi:HD-GYP domain-containing protein (c-di-GMP phosphodiesterase class II)/DNA-binding CsgD family transcriptional regulator
MTEQRLRLAGLLAALSVATDLGMGRQPETAIRSCLMASGLARAMDLPDRGARDVLFVSLVRHLGCTATASLEARLYGGDELASRRAAEPADFGDHREMLALALGTGRGTGLRRPHLIAGAVLGEMRHGAAIFEAVCEAGSLLAARLGLDDEVRATLAQVFERWDGTGGPEGLAGERIALPARISEVATQAVLAAASGGPEAALDTVRRRAGGWFDPSVVDTFSRAGADLLREIDATDPWEAVLAAEPTPVRYITYAELDGVARTFADMVDLKSTYTLGHSAGVAELAERAARTLNLAARDVDDLRRAALLHDLGRVAVSSAIWDKLGPLTRGEQEQVRLHPYHTERILSCSPVLQPLVRIAGMHHERLDGSGYHHGVPAPAIPLAARILAAADAFQTATQPRPHRPARSPEQAADLMVAEANAGRLDPDCVKAVVEAAGESPSRMRPSWPAGLSDRELEVLRLVARGLTNREVAEALVISRRTAEHHVQHVYVKIGCSTRAGAALFAMEHDLLRP